MKQYKVVRLDLVRKTCHTSEGDFDFSRFNDPVAIQEYVLNYYAQQGLRLVPMYIPVGGGAMDLYFEG